MVGWSSSTIDCTRRRSLGTELTAWQSFGLSKVTVQFGRQLKMKANFLSVSLVAGGLLVAALPVLAHHSFAAEYDSNKPVTLTGAVSKVEWMNPHARFYVDVKDEGGKMVNWEFELGSPN